MVVLAGWLGTASASAQPCTVGVDVSAARDRLPSACTRIPLSGRALGPLAPGLGAGVTVFTSGPAGPAAQRIGRDGRPSTNVPIGTGEADGAVRSADGAVWFTTGRSIARLDPAGTLSSFPAPASGQIVLGADGALWFIAGRTVGRMTQSGEVTLLRLPDGLQAVDGVAVGPDRAVWFGAGGRIGRIDPDGGVRSFALPAGLHADGRMTAGAGAVWFADRRDSRIGRVDSTGATRSFVSTGTPTGLAVGADGATLWYASTTFRAGFINRLVIRNLPAGRARGVRCDPRHPPACGRFGAVTTGNTVLLDAFGATGDVVRGDDGEIWFTEDRYLGRVMPFRGVLLCGGALRHSLHSFHAAADCTQQRVPRFKVTHSGVAYVRVSCLRLTLRYCAGTIELREASSAGGRARLAGRTGFAVVAFDNPTVSVPLDAATARAVRRGPLRLRATIRAWDGGGMSRTTTASLVVTGAR